MVIKNFKRQRPNLQKFLNMCSDKNFLNKTCLSSKLFLASQVSLCDNLSYLANAIDIGSDIDRNINKDIVYHNKRYFIEQSIKYFKHGEHF